MLITPKMEEYTLITQVRNGHPICVDGGLCLPIIKAPFAGVIKQLSCQQGRVCR